MAKRQKPLAIGVGDKQRKRSLSPLARPGDPAGEEVLERPVTDRNGIHFRKGERIQPDRVARVVAYILRTGEVLPLADLAAGMSSDPANADKLLNRVRLEKKPSKGQRRRRNRKRKREAAARYAAAAPYGPLCDPARPLALGSGPLSADRAARPARQTVDVYRPGLDPAGPRPEPVKLVNPLAELAAARKEAAARNEREAAERVAEAARRAEVRRMIARYPMGRREG